MDTAPVVSSVHMPPTASPPVVPHLKPWLFKKGTSGNPKGRPKGSHHTVKKFVHAVAKQLVKAPHVPVPQGRLYQQVSESPPTTSTDYASALLQQPLVRDRVAALVNEYIPLKYLVNRVRRMTKASNGVYHRGIRVATEPNHAAQISALELSLKLHKALSPDTSHIQIDNRHVNYTADVDIERLGRIAQTLDSLTKKLYDQPATTNGERTT